MHKPALSCLVHRGLDSRHRRDDVAPVRATLVWHGYTHLEQVAVPVWHSYTDKYTLTNPARCNERRTLTRERRWQTGRFPASERASPIAAAGLSAVSGAWSRRWKVHKGGSPTIRPRRAVGVCDCGRG